jgi:REP element-mobilizing transposase RayT
MARRMQQLELRPHTWGGRRDGAGRKPVPGRRAVPHRPRTPHQRHCPAHVTLRASSAVPSLRAGRLLLATQNALAAASTARFRVLHYSVQADHLHLLVEANGPTEFERGVRGLVIRVAKAVNRALGRAGRVWADRYYAREPRARCGMRSCTCSTTSRSTCARLAGSIRARRHGGSTGGGMRPNALSRRRPSHRRARGSLGSAGGAVASSTSTRAPRHKISGGLTAYRCVAPPSNSFGYYSSSRLV